jgi:hypothetical protein
MNSGRCSRLCQGCHRSTRRKNKGYEEAARKARRRRSPPPRQAPTIAAPISKR